MPCRRQRQQWPLLPCAGSEANRTRHQVDESSSAAVLQCYSPDRRSPAAQHIVGEAREHAATPAATRGDGSS